MAINVTELYSENSRDPLPRIQVAEGPGAVKIQPLAGAASPVLFPEGTPVYIDPTTGFIAALNAGGTTPTNVLYGFLRHETQQAATGTEVLCAVVTRGSIHYDDVEAIRAAGGIIGGTAAQLRTVLRDANNRALGLTIEGLTFQDSDVAT